MEKARTQEGREEGPMGGERGYENIIQVQGMCADKLMAFPSMQAAREISQSIERCVVRDEKGESWTHKRRSIQWM